MLNLNPFAISSLLIVIIYLPYFIFFLINAKNKPAFIASLHFLSIFTWGLFGFFIGITKNVEIATHLWKYAYTGVLFIPVTLQHLVFALKDKKTNFYLVIVYLQAIFFTYKIFDGSMFPSLRMINDSHYFHNDGLLYTCSFIIWVILALVANTELYLSFRDKITENTSHTKYLTLNNLAFIGGIHNFLPSYIDTYPYGNFLVCLPVFFTNYSIYFYRVIDIKLVIRKSTVYTILLTLISVIYLLSILIFEKALQNHYGYKSFAISISIAFLLGLVFVPLRYKIQHLVDKYFFKGSQEEIAKENALLRAEVAQKEKFKSTSTLASGVAHEIKNPLTAIQTFTEFLPKKIDDKEFLLKFSKLVNNEVGRINHMVNELLNYGKPSPAKMEPCNIVKLINDTLDILNSKVITQRIQVIREYNEKEEIHLNLDANQIKQALLNIFLNSLEVMPNKGVLYITVKPQETTLSVIIQDSGPGIPKDELPHIFDPFFSKKDQGTGLGLSITQSIIENHKGKITATSQKGVGTKFVIELPYTKS